MGGPLQINRMDVGVSPGLWKTVWKAGDTYRGYRITYDPKPIPDRRWDWDFVHEDYDGAPNYPGDGPGDHRCGNAASVEACRAEIDMLEDDR